jgi:hypothetical protein
MTRWKRLRNYRYRSDTIRALKPSGIFASAAATASPCSASTKLSHGAGTLHSASQATEEKFKKKKKKIGAICLQFDILKNGRKRISALGINLLN